MTKRNKNNQNNRKAKAIRITSIIEEQSTIENQLKNIRKLIGDKFRIRKMSKRKKRKSKSISLPYL